MFGQRGEGADYVPYNDCITSVNKEGRTRSVLRSVCSTQERKRESAVTRRCEDGINRWEGV